MKLSALFASLDQLAPEIGLNIAGASSIKTKVGAALSLAYLGAFFWLCVWILSEFFSTNNPNLSVEVSSSNNYPRIDMLADRHVPVLFFYRDLSVNLNGKDVLRYVTVRSKFTSYIQRLDGQGQPVTEVLEQSFDYVPCSQLGDQAKVRRMVTSDSSYLNKLVGDFGLCIDDRGQELFIQGTGSDAHFRANNLEIYPCSLGPDCLATSPEILARISFVLSKPVPNLNLSNLERPVSYYSSFDDLYNLNPATGQRINLKLMASEIYDDKGFLTRESLRVAYTENERVLSNQRYRSASQLSCTPEEIGSGACVYLFSLEFVSGGTVKKTTRFYKGVVETIGDIGGCKEIVYFVFFAVYSCYHRRATREILLQKVYSLAPQTGSKECDQVFAVIEDSLDVVTICQQLNVLKFVAKYLLGDRHRQLAPLIALDEDLGRKKPKAKLLLSNHMAVSESIRALATRKHHPLDAFAMGCLQKIDWLDDRCRHQQDPPGPDLLLRKPFPNLIKKLESLPGPSPKLRVEERCPKKRYSIRALLS